MSTGENSSCPNEDVAVKEEPAIQAQAKIKEEEAVDEEKPPPITQPQRKNDEDLKCPICHENVRNPIGSPDCCDHIYCSRCIRKWAKSMNRCPLDRLKFDFIFIRKSPTSPQIVRRIPVRDCDLVVDNITFTASEAAAMFHDPDDDYCQMCGQSNDPEVLLLCDACSLGYHTYCLVPALGGIPEGDWFCPVCRPGLTDETGSQLSLASTSTAGVVDSSTAGRRIRRASLPSSSSAAARRRRFQRRRTRTQSTTVGTTARQQIRDIAQEVQRLLGIADALANGSEGEEEVGEGENGTQESGARYSLPVTGSTRRVTPGVTRRRGRKVRRRRGRRRRVVRRRRRATGGIRCRTLAARRALAASRNRRGQQSAAVIEAAASRARLIARLGIVRIRRGTETPIIKLPQNVNAPLRSGRIPVSVGGPSAALFQSNELSIFGNDYQGPSFEEEDLVPPHPVAAIPISPAIPRVSGDFLSGLIESQAFLHLPASKLRIAADGRLQQEEARQSRLSRIPSFNGPSSSSSSQPTRLRQSIVTCGVSSGDAGSGTTTTAGNEPVSGGNHGGEMYDPFHPTSEDSSAMSMSPQDRAAGGGGGGGGGPAGVPPPAENGRFSQGNRSQASKIVVKPQQKSDSKKSANVFKVTDSEPEEDLLIREDDGNGGTKKRRHSSQEPSEGTLPPGISPQIDFSSTSTSKRDDKDPVDKGQKSSEKGLKQRRRESRSRSSSSRRHSSSKHHKHHHHHREEDEKPPSSKDERKRISNSNRRRSRSRSNSRNRGLGNRGAGGGGGGRPGWRAPGLSSPPRKVSGNRRSRSRSRSRSRHRDRSKNDTSHDRDRDIRRGGPVVKSPSPRKSRPERRGDGGGQRDRGQNNSTSSDRRKVSSERKDDNSLLQSPSSGRRDPFALLSAEADAKMNAIRQQQQQQQVVTSSASGNLEQNVPPIQQQAPQPAQLSQFQQIIASSNPSLLYLTPETLDPAHVLMAASGQVQQAQPQQSHHHHHLAGSGDMFSQAASWPSLPLPPPPFPVNIAFPPPPMPHDQPPQSWMGSGINNQPPQPLPQHQLPQAPHMPPAGGGKQPTPQSILQSLAALGAIINKGKQPPGHGPPPGSKKSAEKAAPSKDHHPPPPPPPPPKAAGKSQVSKVEQAPEEETVLSVSNSSDDVPASAVDLQNKQAMKAGKQMLTEIEERVKKIVKPSYVSGKLDKEGYKEVMKKCVTKIFAKRPKHINEEKMKEFVEAYLSRAVADSANRKKHQRHSQQHHNRPDSGTSSSADAPTGSSHQQQKKTTSSSSTAAPPPPPPPLC